MITKKIKSHDSEKDLTNYIFQMDREYTLDEFLTEVMKDSLQYSGRIQVTKNISLFPIIMTIPYEENGNAHIQDQKTYDKYKYRKVDSAQAVGSWNHLNILVLISKKDK